MISPRLRALLTLHLVPGLGPRLTDALLNRFGSPELVLKATPADLREVPYIGARLAGDIARAIQEVDVDAELDRMARHRVSLLSLGGEGYPERLATISDPPHLLYIRGRIEPADGRAVALVGSRQCTAYGRRMTERLARGLVDAGYTVVSGLARGIDGCAHRAALEKSGRTLAVLAGGLTRIYPPEHAGLADEVEGQGALITEAAMTQEPLPGMFPQRNRLISGLSQAIVIVEAAERSGALLTATHAAEQGRTVLAVPGPADNPASGGTNALIRQGAILCRGVEDVLEELEGVRAQEQPAPAPPPPPPELDGPAKQVWDLLSDGPLTLDQIIQQLGLSVARLSGILLTLEMKKVVRRLPGNRYERC